MQRRSYYISYDSYNLVKDIIGKFKCQSWKFMCFSRSTNFWLWLPNEWPFSFIGCKAFSKCEHMQWEFQVCNIVMIWRHSPRFPHPHPFCQSSSIRSLASRELNALARKPEFCLPLNSPTFLRQLLGNTEKLQGQWWKWRLNALHCSCPE